MTAYNDEDFFEYRTLPINQSISLQYDDFSSVLDSPQPVVISRQSTEDRNPFGATFAYGTRQVVVEVR